MHRALVVDGPRPRRHPERRRPALHSRLGRHDVNDVSADISPRHAASIGVGHRVWLTATKAIIDGQTRWISDPADDHADVRDEAQRTLDEVGLAAARRSEGERRQNREFGDPTPQSRSRPLLALLRSYRLGRSCRLKRTRSRRSVRRMRPGWRDSSSECSRSYRAAFTSASCIFASARCCPPGSRYDTLGPFIDSFRGYEPPGSATTLR